MPISAFKYVFIHPNYPYSFKLDWELEDPILVGDYHFTIQRSESVEGPWETVTTQDNTLFYEDIYYYTSKESRIYYRILGEDPAGVYFESEPKNLYRTLGDKNYITFKRIQAKETLLYTKKTGIEIDFYRRKTLGNSCSVCIDEVTNQPLKANCSNCYGTGVEGGYCSPVRLYALLEDKNVSTAITDFGLSEDCQSIVRSIAYPLLHKWDILKTVEDNRRFVVESIQYIYVRTSPVIQVMGVNQVSKTSSEYCLP